MAELKMTPEFKETFVDMLTSIPNITAVCKLLGVAHSTVSKTRGSDPEFAAAISDALECGYDMLEEEARRRAVDGVLKPVWFQGEEVGSVREYSDALLMFLLKGNRPKKYNPTAQVKIDNPNKVSMTFNLSGE